MNNQDKTIEYLAIDKLRFDPENPRLPSTLDKRDERKVFEWMLRDGTITELMGSIGETGYFAGEPVLVVGPDRQGFYNVIEGNRRLCAVKLLLHPDLAPVRKKSVQAVSEEANERPPSLPAIVYKDRREILDYLGYRHITGIKEWGSLAKARYLHQLYQALKDKGDKAPFKTIAKTIGSRADYVARLLTSLGIYEKIAQSDFFDIPNLNEESIDFSVLTTAFNYTSISEFLGLESPSDLSLKGINNRHLKLLTSWLFEKDASGKTRLGESRNLKELSAIVQTPKALAAMVNGAPLKTAFLLAQQPTDIFRVSINAARSQLYTAHEYSHLVDNPSTADIETLVEIQKITRNLRLVVVSQITDKDEES